MYEKNAAKTQVFGEKILKQRERWTKLAPLWTIYISSLLILNIINISTKIKKHAGELNIHGIKTFPLSLYNIFDISILFKRPLRLIYCQVTQKNKLNKLLSLNSNNKLLLILWLSLGALLILIISENATSNGTCLCLVCFKSSRIACLLIDFWAFTKKWKMFLKVCLHLRNFLRKVWFIIKPFIQFWYFTVNMSN